MGSVTVSPKCYILLKLKSVTLSIIFWLLKLKNSVTVGLKVLCNSSVTLPIFEAKKCYVTVRGGYIISPLLRTLLRFCYQQRDGAKPDKITLLLRNLLRL